MGLRDYDAAMVARYQPTVTAVNGVDTNRVAVPGIAAPVPVYFGLPEEWFAKYALPAINVSRVAPRPAVDRRRSGYRILELSSNPATPNEFNEQVYLAEPVDLMYTIELAALRQADLNALVEHTALRFPATGYHSYVTVNTRLMPFEQQSSADLTDYTQNADGRVLRFALTYLVQGWLAPVDCAKVPQILTVDAPVSDTWPPPDSP